MLRFKPPCHAGGVDASCIGLRPMPRVAKVSTVLRSWRMDRQMVEPGNDQHIVVASEFQGGSKLWGLRDVCGQDGP